MLARLKLRKILNKSLANQENSKPKHSKNLEEICKREDSYTPEDIIKRFNKIAAHYKSKSVKAKSKQIKKYTYNEAPKQNYEIEFVIKGKLKDKTKYQIDIERKYDKRFEILYPRTKININIITNNKTKISFYADEEKPISDIIIDDSEFEIKRVETDKEIKKIYNFASKKYSEIISLINDTAPDLFETAIKPKISRFSYNKIKLEAIKKLEIK
ncbi:hypothetical protein HOK51_09350 [Candidatus Woesearchaeota archaeon]|jgi:hypothetical protein|nr:hypothetical protein [Candidatus Woesearchaeota archaeon]MBT6520034.1 hypothetical protein [Candidatus Woesearchaeota archaeon]MBT7368617.1 hypothetical protein [Candidatus Woesearchaeota archaeon]